MGRDCCVSAMCGCSVDKTAAGCVPPRSLGQLEMGRDRPPRRSLPRSHCSGNAVGLWNGSGTRGACIGPILSEDVGGTCAWMSLCSDMCVCACVRVAKQACEQSSVLSQWFWQKELLIGMDTSFFFHQKVPMVQGRVPQGGGGDSTDWNSLVIIM